MFDIYQYTDLLQRLFVSAEILCGEMNLDVRVMLLTMHEVTHIDAL
jgi:hypothetical protein